MANITGTSGNDTLTGTANIDNILGLAGDDVLNGLGGPDFLRGDEGNDTSSGGDGNDGIFAGPNDDGDDLSVGGDGDDVIGTSVGDDIAIGDFHDGVLDIGTTTDAGSNTLYLGDGEDLGIIGGYDNDGTDASYSGGLNGGFMGVVTGTDGGVGFAGDSDDVLYGSDGADVLGGGDGADQIYAGTGNDTIYGGGGAGSDDTIEAGAGDHLIFNGGGNGEATGGAGEDTLWGGSGDDTLTGGTEADTFAFAPGTTGADRVTDFDLSEDVLDLQEFFPGTFTNAQSVVDAMSDTVSGAVLQLGGGESVLFLGLTKGQFETASNPIFNISGTPEPGPNPGGDPDAGKTFNLTTGTDTFGPGQSGDDQTTNDDDEFNAVLSQPADNPTLNASDIVRGSGGTDRMNLTLDTSPAPFPAAQVDSVENWFINNQIGGISGSLTFGNFNGEEEVWNSGSSVGSDVFVRDLAAGTAVGVSNTLSDTFATYAAGALASGAQIDLVVEDVGASSALPTVAIDPNQSSGSDTNTLKIDSSGENFIILETSASLAGSGDGDTTKIEATGGGDLTILTNGPDDAAIDEFDGSTATGDITAVLDTIQDSGTSDLFQTGDGNDFISSISMGYEAIDQANLGDGQDIFAIDVADVGNVGNISEVETLLLSDSGGGGVNTFALPTGFDEIGVLDSDGGFDDAFEPASVTPAQDWAMAGETDLYLALNMAGAAASDDQVDVRLFGAGDLGGGTASRLEIADVETVEFTLKDGGSLGVPTLTQEDSLVDLVDTGATNALETLVVKGDNADVDLGSVTSMGTTFASVASSALSTVDLTDFSGETAIDITSNNSTEVLGSAQLDDIVGAAGGTVANLGAGGDRLDLTASSSLGVGSAVDTIVLEAGDSQAGGTGAFPNLNFDGVIGFEAGIDGFDLGAFGFSGQQTSALASLSTTEADALAGGFFGGSGPASDIADAFSSGGADRAVAIGTTSGIAGAQVAVVDVDENGDFDVATDLMFAVETISGASLTVGDFGF